MRKNDKILYNMMFALLSINICLFLRHIDSFAANVIKPVESLAGPGTIEAQAKMKIDNIRKTNSIASQSEIFLHDGVYYIKGEDKGKFSLTGYCACKKCGTGTGLTASGKKVRENHTIASDWKVLPKGTMIILDEATGKDGTSYNGVYQVEDRGGGVKNNHIDIYRPTHDLAALVTYYGRCYGHVYIAVPIAKESDFQ